jgi:peptidyl-prolyl cis-trans isomerase C
MLGRSARIAGAVLRAPALHFLVLGALLAGAAARLEGAAADGRPPIVISAARVDEIRDDYQRSSLTAPTDDELSALVARDADEEMLYREALLLGLDRGDRAVKFRIVDKMHFLYGDAAGDVETAYRRGLALGLQRDDVVVKNTLVTKMRLLAKAASRSEEPSGPGLDAELQTYLDAHAEAYATAARMSVTQVFVSAERHGAALERDARALAAHLRTAAVPPADAARLGDPFVAGATFTHGSRDTLAKTFGADLAAAVAALPVGRWSDPIASPYGRHVVQVTARDSVTVPPLAAVRSRVLLAYRAERRAEYLERMMSQVRAAYDVRVERHG